MRLRPLLTSLSTPSALISALESSSLKTTTDLLFGLPTHAQYLLLPPDTISYDVFVQLKDDVAAAFAPLGVRANELLSRAREAEGTRYAGECGVRSVDEVLGGGMGRYAVYELSGRTGTCKTLIAFHIVLRYLVHDPRGTCLWLDTTASFSAERAQAVLALLSGPGKETALDRLNISVVFDVQPVIELLDDIRQSISLARPSPSPSSTRFVVIDSITPLLASHLSSASAQGHATLQSLLRQLRALSSSSRLTTLLINTAVSSHPHNPLSAFSATAHKPALGPTFTFGADVTVWCASGAEVFGREETDGEEESKSEGVKGMERVYVVEVLRARSSASRVWEAFKSDGVKLQSV